MKETMTQEQRLDYLVEAFKKDSDGYQDIQTPGDNEGKKTLLRSLMNIRMPHALSEDVVHTQDEYLSFRNEEKGIIGLSEIPTVQDALHSQAPHANKLSIWQGDITRLACDAIVNAANSQMLGCFVPMHTCIDNCIHTYAGIQLRAECNKKMNQLRAKYGADYEQPTAIPMLTEAYNLPAKKVVHIVGPIVQGRLTRALEQDLADCYQNTLDLCQKEGLESVAFCCISTGVFHFPNERAAEIAVKTVQNWLSQNESNNKIERVIFNVFKNEDKEYYERQFSQMR